MNRIEAINRVIKDTKAKSLLYIGNNGEISADIKCNHIDTDFNQSYDVAFINGAFDYRGLQDFLFSIEAKTLVLSNVLPISEDFTNLNWCGEGFKLAHDIHNCTPYYKVLRQDYGVLVVELKDLDGIKSSNKDYTSLDDLLETFNVVGNIEDLLFEFPTDLPEKPKDNLPIEFPSEIVEVELGVDQADDYSQYSDDEIKQVYKELSGKGLRGKFNREKAIKKIKELL